MPVRSWIGAATAALLALATPSAATLAVASQAQAAGTTVSCADVVLITLVGSGEKQSDETTTMARVETAFVAHMASAKVGQRSLKLTTERLPYAAAPLQVIPTQIGGLSLYLDSVQNGIDLLRERIRALSVNCKGQGQRYTLAGFSQGAIAIHQYVTDIARTAPDVAAVIDGVALVGDGARVANTKVGTMGTAQPKATGIVDQARSAGIWRYPAPQDVAAPLRARTVDLCDAGDLICDTNGAMKKCWLPWWVSPALCAPAVLSGVDIHLTHYQSSADAVATKLAGFARGYPRPAQPSLTLTGTVGVPQSWPLDASLQQAKDVTWQVGPGQQLPPGVSLHDGFLRGTPTTPGAYSFVVQAVRKGYPPAPIAVHLAIANPLIAGTVPDATVGEPYSAQLETSLKGLLIWQFLDDLPTPAGLALSDSGLLSGTPTRAGDVTFGVLVINDNGEQASGAVVLRVKEAPAPTGPWLSLREHTRGEPYPVPTGLSDKPVAEIEQSYNQIVVLYADGTVERRQWMARDWMSYPIPPPTDGTGRITRISGSGAYMTDGSAVYNFFGRTIRPDYPEQNRRFVDMAGDDQVGVLLDDHGYVYVDGVPYNWSGPHSAPPQIQDQATAIAYANFTAAAVSRTGSVVVWGMESERLTPPADLCPSRVVRLVGTGAASVCTDGSVRVWGLPSGDSRQNVPAGLTGVKDVTLGNGFGLALKQDGTLVAWGEDAGSVPTGLTRVTSISAGLLEAIGRG